MVHLPRFCQTRRLYARQVTINGISVMVAAYTFRTLHLLHCLPVRYTATVYDALALRLTVVATRFERTLPLGATPALRGTRFAPLRCVVAAAFAWLPARTLQVRLG